MICPKYVVALLTLALTGCVKTVEVPVIKEVVKEVRVPVSVPCVKNRPAEVAALRDRLGRAEWNALGTDQREKLLQAQAMDRKAFGDSLTVATAGCA